MHLCFSTIDYHQKGQGGGIASYLDALAPALIALGHEVSIIAPGRTSKKYTTERGVNIREVPLGSAHWYLYKLHFPSWIYLLLREWEWSHKLYKAVQTLHNEKSIDLIESHEIGVWSLVRHRSKLPPLIVRLHGSPYVFKAFSEQKPTLGEKLTHRLELKLLQKVNAITAPGKYQSEMYSEWIGKDVVHLPNPLSSKFESALLGEERTPKQDFNVLLYTGRIEYRKGSLDLIKALGMVIQRFPTIRLVMAGALHNSISPETLEDSISKAGVQKHLELKGHVEFKELVSIYSSASIFVMPSYYETFGISVIEAMAFGLPIVASNSGALPELIEHGKTGLLVPKGNSEALAEAILYLLSHKKEAIEMGKKARKKVLETYLASTVAKQMSAFYQNNINPLT